MGSDPRSFALAQLRSLCSLLTHARSHQSSALRCLPPHFPLPSSVSRGQVSEWCNRLRRLHMFSWVLVPFELSRRNGHTMHCWILLPGWCSCDGEGNLLMACVGRIFFFFFLNRLPLCAPLSTDPVQCEHPVLASRSIILLRVRCWSLPGWYVRVNHQSLHGRNVDPVGGH